MSKSEHPNDRDRMTLERMTTAELEELLRQDFHAPEGGTGDMSELYRAAQVLAGREAEPVNADRAWARFQENYLPFVPARSAFYEDGVSPSSDAAPGRRRFPLRRWWKRGILVAAALVLLLLSVSIAGADGGYDFWRHLARWTDEQLTMDEKTVFRADGDSIHIPEEEKEYATLQEALADYGLTQPLAPSWVPEGFEMGEVEVDGFQDMGHIMFWVNYRRGEEILVIFISVYFDMDGGVMVDPGGDFQKDEGDPVPYRAGGVTHMLFTNAGRPSAVWVNGPAECSITTDATMDELKQVIDSIYKTK